MLGNTPMQTFDFNLEQGKSFAFTMKFWLADGTEYDISESALRLVVAQPARYGGAEVIAETLLSSTPGTLNTAQFQLQAEDLDLTPAEYPYDITLLSQNGYTTPVMKGVFNIGSNVDTYSSNVYSFTDPTEWIDVAIHNGATINIKLGNAPYYSGVGSQLEVLDEGVVEDSLVTSIDFVGAGVSVTNPTAGHVVVTIPGGGGGGSGFATDIVTDDTGWSQIGGTNVQSALDNTDSALVSQVAATGAVSTALTNHLMDTTAAHAASAVSVTDEFISSDSTNVQDVLDDLDQALDAATTLLTNSINNHLADTTDAHAASAISAVDEFANSSSTNVQDVLDDLDAAITVNGASIGAVDTAISNHLADTTDAHDASAISAVDEFTNSSSTNVQDVLDDLDLAISNNASAIATDATNLTNHLNDTTDAHDASAISAVDEFSNSSSTNVQDVLDDLDAAITVNGASIGAVDTALSNHLADTTDAHDASAISLVTTGFDGNLDSGVTNVQLLADAVDELVGGGGGAVAAADVSAVDEFANSSSTNVQDVLDDLDTAISINGASIGAVDTAISNHLADTTDAHDASAISLVTTGFDGNLDGTVTNVQLLADAVDELVGGGGGAAFTTGTATPSGGADNDMYLETDTGTWWKKISGTWTVIAGVSHAPLNNTGEFPTSRTRVGLLTASDADTWTNASESLGTVTLTNGTASITVNKPSRWMAQYQIKALPGAGQTLTLYCGALGAIPKVVITNTGGCTLVSGSYTYHVFPTISVGQSIAVVGGPGYVLVSMLDTVAGGNDILDRELFVASDLSRGNLDSLGIKLGGTGYGQFAPSALEAE